ncbi:MAG: hypothetical protein MJE66_17375 [Proteobacteria bacterium]|nr:hypothetical protein [Pseudomonadota bacterium]
MVERLLTSIAAWAEDTPGLVAVALVGSHDPGCGRVVVVDDDRGPALGLLGLEIQPLARNVPLRVALPDVLAAAEPLGIAPLGPGQRHGEVRAHEDGEVPVPPQLGPEQKHAVEEQDRVRVRLLQRRVHGGVGPVVEERAPKTAVARRSERIQQRRDQAGVIERVLEVASGRSHALAVPDLGRVMEAVDGSADHASPPRPQQFDQLVGQCRFAGRVDPVDGDARGMRPTQVHNLGGETGDQFSPLQPPSRRR